jgi:hypothetical protein
MLSDTELRRIYAQLPATLMEATVLDPPTTNEGWLRVEIDNRPGSIEVVPWIPRVDIDPAPHDAALVSESDGGNFWAIAWWPQSGATPSLPALPLPAIEAWRYVGTVGQPAFSGGWGNSVSGTGRLRFRKDQIGKVHIEGRIVGAAGGTAFTLPTGYRPLMDTFRPLLQSGGLAGSYILVTAAGLVQPTVSASTNEAFISASFFTD